jgi:hypothetical protein
MGHASKKIIGPYRVGPQAYLSSWAIMGWPHGLFGRPLKELKKKF